MPSSVSLSSYTHFWLPAGRTAISSDTETLFRTNHSISEAYQTALATTRDYLSSRFINDNDESNNAPNNETAAGQLSTDDARARARTAWSRAYSEGHPEPRYNRPNISGALSTPPMPHIITDYTTSLIRQEYYMFLERCWNVLEKETTSNQRNGPDLLEEVPPPITAYSFDLLGLGDSPLQAAVLVVNRDASIDNEVSVTDEIPVDQSTLDSLVDLIDDLLADDGASTISDRFINIALAEEDESELEDSDKENSAPPLFFPNYESDEGYEESDNSSELEGSDKENMRPLSPLSLFSDGYPLSGNSLNSSDDENESPLGNSEKANARPLPFLHCISGTPDVSLDRDDEYDKLDESDMELLEPGTLSTLFYDPYVEFAQDHAPNVFPEAYDEENESELEDSDKESIPAPLSLSTSDNADDEQHAPSDNALMLTFYDGDSAGSMSDYEDTMPSDGEKALIVGAFDDDTEHNSDDSVFNDNNSNDSFSEQNLRCSSSPYSSFSPNIENEGFNNRRAELNDAPHFAYSTNISSNERSGPLQNGSDDSDESDGGYSNSSDDYCYHLTEEPATDTDIAGVPAIPIGSQRRLIDSNQPRQYMMLRPIARLPHRSTINGAKYQNEHLIDGGAAGVGIKNEPIKGYFPKCTSLSATSAGGNELDRFPSATGARTGAANQYDQSKTLEQEDWTDERRVSFPTSYERTPMNN